MLLKFTDADMLNSSLIDVSTGERAYEIVTTPVPPDSEVKADSEQLRSSVQDAPLKERRHTHITSSSGNTLVTMSWNGRHPDINILDEKIGGLTELFGSTTVRFMPKILAIPTRFDTEYIWTATPDSLTLFDYDSETTKGTFYQNVIRVPASFKSRPKPVAPSASSASPSSPSSPSAPSSSCLPSPSSSSSLPSLASSTPSLRSSASSFHLSAPSSHSSASSNAGPTSAPWPTHTETPKSSFIPTHLPGVGNNYLEFCQHPLAHDVEIIVSFLMMEILRRGRFVLTPYTFEKPKLWQLKEARDLVMRRLRRNTV